MVNPITLPEPIAAYFAADRGSSEALMRCFTPDAVVEDEGHTHEGIAAIRQWKAESAMKYTYTSEPFAIELGDGMVIVTSRLTGNFPGSPIDLRFCFRLDGDRIAYLRIAP